MTHEKVYTANEIFAMNQTEKILKSKASDIRKNFYHYTTVETVNKILSGDKDGNHFIFIRSIAAMNDLNEAELHRRNGNKIHSFCTCCSEHEKIPLWYLYSGLGGSGARIGFSPGKMLKFLNSIDIVYPVEENGINYSNPLRVSKDFDMFCGWVYYLMEGNNRIFYKNNFFAVEEISEKVLEQSYFVKNYPWEYEREFRIVIKNKTNKIYERIAIPFPAKLVSSLEIMSAPEYSFTEKEKKRYLGFGIKPEKIKKSKLNIKMDLLRNNREFIVNQMEKWCDEGCCSSICTFVQTKRKCNHKEEK